MVYSQFLNEFTFETLNLFVFLRELNSILNELGQDKNKKDGW